MYYVLSSRDSDSFFFLFLSSPVCNCMKSASSEYHHAKPAFPFIFDLCSEDLKRFFMSIIFFMVFFLLWYCGIFAEMMKKTHKENECMKKRMWYVHVGGTLCHMKVYPTVMLSRLSSLLSIHCQIDAFACSFFLYSIVFLSIRARFHCYVCFFFYLKVSF